MTPSNIKNLPLLILHQNLKLWFSLLIQLQLKQQITCAYVTFAKINKSLVHLFKKYTADEIILNHIKLHSEIPEDTSDISDDLDNLVAEYMYQTPL